MATNMFPIRNEFPYFLRDYGKLLAHFEAEFEGLIPKEKGQRFAEFTQRLVPHSEPGRQFEEPQLGPKQTYDEGVDLSCQSSDGRAVLFIQSKYTIPGVDSLDSIMSKFETYEANRTCELQPKLMPDADEKRPPTSHFMVVTAQDLHGRILPRYLNSKRKTLGFYNSLKGRGRVHIIDGPQILQLLQEAYRKSYLLPAKISLSVTEPFIHTQNVYIGILAASELRRLYNEFGNALFLENIREYLGPTSGKLRAEPGWTTVNQAIAETLATHAEEFLARNNGVVFRASAVTADEATLTLEEASIVNGCQTTMAIVQNPEQECSVLFKVVETEDAWDIAEAANFQNEIDQITLTLARYVRPQMIRAAATKFGIRLEGPKESTAFAVLDSIYQEEITEKEFRALFLGFFSNLPRNALAANYARLNVGVIDRLFGEGNPDKDYAFELLFRVLQMTQSGAAKVVDALQGEERLLDLFRRFWQDERYSYRAFLAVLASVACTRINIYSPSSLPTYDDSMKLFARLQTIIDQEPEVFFRYYHWAFASVALEALKDDQSREEMLQQMKRTIETSSFDNLVLRVRALASTDQTTRQGVSV